MRDQLTVYTSDGVVESRDGCPKRQAAVLGSLMSRPQELYQANPFPWPLDARRAPEEAVSFFLDVSAAELDAALPKKAQTVRSLHLMRPSMFQLNS